MLKKIIFLYCTALLLFMSEVILEHQEPHEFNLNFFQHDYNVTPERLEMVSVNKAYANHFEVFTFKYNRSTTAFNFTANFKFDVLKLEMVIQAYKFLSNEYREFPMRFQVNFCKAIKANMAGMGRFSCGNFSGCPLIKGRTYRMCNWAPDQSKFPPYLPTGRYMFEMEGLYLSTQVALVRGYYAITRREV